MVEHWITKNNTNESYKNKIKVEHNELYIAIDVTSVKYLPKNKTLNIEKYDCRSPFKIYHFYVYNIQTQYFIWNIWISFYSK